jgi:maleate cis-trans isomerase
MGAIFASLRQFGKHSRLEGEIAMYAWRARIGLIKPTHRGKSFHFWYDRAPNGVEIVPTFVGFRRSDRQTFENAFERIDHIADDLKAVGCKIISVSGTPPVLLKGLDFEREWRDRLSQKLGLPVISQMEPHALALLALGVKRVAIATYYGDELNNAIVRYFSHFDIEGIVMGGLSVLGQGDALYTTSLMALDEVSHMQVYQYCKAGFQRITPRVDAIYINGGGWDAPPAINVLERDLGAKVIFALAAEMWATYRQLAIDPEVEDCGALLRDNPAVPAVAN